MADPIDVSAALRSAFPDAVAANGTSLPFNYTFSTEAVPGGPFTWSGVMTVDANSIVNGQVTSVACRFSTPQNGLWAPNVGMLEAGPGLPARPRQTFIVRLPCPQHTCYTLYAVQPSVMAWGDVHQAMIAHSQRPSASPAPSHPMAAALPVAPQVVYAPAGDVNQRWGYPAGSEVFMQGFSEAEAPSAMNPQTWRGQPTSLMQQLCPMFELEFRTTVGPAMCLQRARQMSAYFVLLRMCVWVALHAPSIGIPLVCVAINVLRMTALAWTPSIRMEETMKAIQGDEPSGNIFLDNAVRAQRGRGGANNGKSKKKPGNGNGGAGQH
jgi:hypothetical protein